MSVSNHKCIVSINLGNFGSTGTIMNGICDVAEKQGAMTYRAYPGDKRNYPKKERDIIIINDLLRRISRKLSYITGYNGCFAIWSTLFFLHKLDRIAPDIIHIHNLHNSYMNFPLLFSYIKKKKIKVIWTLHDCWSFTGQCPHFIYEKCDKWKLGCDRCQKIDMYPAAKVDRTRRMWNLKRKCFTGVEDLTIVTPSQWLEGLVKQSFLKAYPVQVINNGIDLDTFKPTESGFRRTYHLDGKYILLGVAFGWSSRKGIDVFIRLASELDERFQIILVGTNEEAAQILPKNIISIHKMSDQKELAEIYSSADLLINASREENYPTVNMEAIACGTPVITFRTGGGPEIVDENCGYVVDVDDIAELKKQIVRICTENVFSRDGCLERAKTFDRNIKYKEYLTLYEVYMETD